MSTYQTNTYDGVAFMKWTMDTYHWILETIKRSDNTKGFVLLPKRWVVERTWGWLNWSRRLSKDYEVLPATSETFIYDCDDSHYAQAASVSFEFSGILSDISTRPT